MSIEHLAVLGGAPAFTTPLHVGRPNIADTDTLLERFRDVLESRWLTNDGEQVRELEAALAARLDVPHVVAMCNGTIALEIAIRALDLTGEVIVPGFTFVATAHALQWQGIKPVFADVRCADHTLDPHSVTKLITPHTTGIIGVHLWGNPCDVPALQGIADDHGLELLFDAAHAFGCHRDGAPIGGFGRAEVFSFHATKFFNTFEGGAVATHDPALAEKMRLMRNFGFAGLDNAIHVGTNGKMTEICAAMGNVGLGVIDQVIAANTANHHAYRNGLLGCPGVQVLTPAADSNHQYVIVDVDPDLCPLTRDEIVAVLAAENVLARRYFTPGAHRMQPYRDYQPNAGLMLPVTEALADRILALPTGTAISPAEATHVTDLIRAAVTHAAAVRSATRGIAA